jgi:DNA modification methylase
MRKEVIGDATLWLGDCMEVLPTLPKVDAVITDPPYGLNLGKQTSAKETRTQLLRKQAYESYEDTPENFRDQIVPAVVVALSIADRGMVFGAAPSMWMLPAPRAIGGFYIPFGCGRTAWGFTAFSQCLLYGSAPDLHLGCKATGRVSNETPERGIDHPCPKPLGWMTWCVDLGSRAGETVLDPFMGSGTTGVSAIQLGRKFIGIEREPKYFDIACRRIEQAYKQRPLFDAEPPRKPEQLGLESA